MCVGGGGGGGVVSVPEGKNLLLCGAKAFL